MSVRWRPGPSRGGHSGHSADPGAVAVCVGLVGPRAPTVSLWRGGGVTVFVELCCGSAAVTLRLLGGRRPPAPYQGAKTAYTGDIIDALGLRGRRFDEYLFVDSGPWAIVWSVLVDPHARAAVADRLRVMHRHGPKGEGLFELARSDRYTCGGVEWVSAFLVLQTANHRSKPVTWSESGGWQTSGYSHLSRSSVELGFKSRVNASRIAERIDHLPDLGRVRVIQGCATDIEPRPGVVYLDPPYALRSGYGPDDLTRDQVVDIARRWAPIATVAVSEAEPVADLGWPSVGLRRQLGRNCGPRNFGKVDEYLTANQPMVLRPRPVQLDLAIGGAA